MYLLGKDTYWFQPAIVSIAYRTSELSYSAEAMCEGRVGGRYGWAVCYNKWVARAGVAFFLPLFYGRHGRRPAARQPHRRGKDFAAHMVHALLLPHYFATSSTEFELDLCV